jgi:uncharacterized membrane protein
MKRKLISSLIILAVGITAIFWGAPALAKMMSTSRPATQVGYDSTTARALVINIKEQGQITLGTQAQTYQIFDIRVLEGQYEGKILEMNYGLNQIRSSSTLVQRGEEILVSVGEKQDGTLAAYFTDFIRTPQLIQLLMLFFLISILVGGWKGVRGLLGIILSMAIIIFFIIPMILKGYNPVWISILGSFVFLALSMYLVYGWNLKTHSAVLGMLLALCLTGGLSALFINIARLTGYGDENAIYLVQMAQANIDLRGLLLGGMIIGSLGVLDDLVISQASAVFELHGANSELSISFLFNRAMNIGHDHVAATVNTLVLAYAGASLPMLLLFSLNNQNLGLLINLDMMAEEIVRTLVGSIGLFLAVPITTGLATLAAKRADRLGKLRPWLGPENSIEGHSHTH